jgi:hypothetical protein
VTLVAGTHGHDNAATIAAVELPTPSSLVALRPTRPAAGRHHVMYDPAGRPATQPARRKGTPQ